MEKSLFKKLMIQGTSVFDRFICWSGYKIGCWRSISSQLKVIDDYNEEDLIEEVDILKNLSCETGLDSQYLRDIVRIRLSAAIIKQLELLGYDNTLIVSDPELLKEMIEKWGEISIDQIDHGYKYDGRSGCVWRIDCDLDNKKRFQLFEIIQIRKTELMK